VKPMEKRGQPTNTAKGLPMISEKSGTPSEVSATWEENCIDFCTNLYHKSFLCLTSSKVNSDVGTCR